MLNKILKYVKNERIRMVARKISFVIICSAILQTISVFANNKDICSGDCQKKCKKTCILPCDRTKKSKKVTKSEDFFDLDNIVSKENVIPIVILGAGPAGLSAGLYGAAQFDSVIIEGEKPSLLTETSYVDNWLGAPHQLGADLIQASHDQAEKAGARFINANVEQVDFESWPYAIKLDDGKTIHAMSLIVATGARPLMLGVPGEKEYWARGVSACARCDAAFFKNKNVVIVGGGDVAVEEAVELSRFAKEVTIVHRRGQLRAADRMQTRLKSYSQVKIMYNTIVKEILGDNKKVNSIKISNTQTGKQEILPIDGVFLAIGHKPNVDLFKDSLEIDDYECLVLQPKNQQTSMRGVFAAGDVANHYRQAIIAAGEGAKAAIDAIEFLESLGFTLTESKKLRYVSS
jgi:thioredoxin reductase (NADPH)